LNENENKDLEEQVDRHRVDLIWQKIKERFMEHVKNKKVNCIFVAKQNDQNNDDLFEIYHLLLIQNKVVPLTQIVSTMLETIIHEKKKLE